MKKIMSLVIVLVMVMSIMILPVTAATGSCGDSINWSLEGGVLTLTGTGEMTKYTRNADTDTVDTPWWNERDSITAIVVGEGITKLNNYAFYACSNLTAVTLPESLERIETRVFAKCPALTSLVFPAKLSYLGYEACVGSGITAIEFKGEPPKVSTTAPLKGLNVTITCPSDAFKAVAFGGNITWNIAGAGTDAPKPDDSPDPAEGIDMSNPSKEGTCGSDAKWAFKDGLLLISGSGEMDKFTRNPDLNIVNTPWYEWRNEIKKVVVAKGITRVNNYSFFQCASLESVALPSTVFAINYGAFKECTSLKEITLPAAVDEIGSQAFAKSGITKITMLCPVPKDSGDMMADGLTAEVLYPCTDADVSIANLKKFGGTLTWTKWHSNENGVCTACGQKESEQGGNTAPTTPNQPTQPQQPQPTAPGSSAPAKEAGSLSALTIINICLSVVALGSIALSIVLVAKMPKKEQ